jgi:RHS repeat-associated protein
MTYNFSATQNNGRIVSSSDGITGENVSYTYDSLNRLIAAATTNGTGPIWGNSYSYDGFGNLTGKTVTQGTAPSALPQVNSATNQARMIGDYGFDANGNWLGMGSQSNAWNAENQLISNGTVDYGGNPLTYTYDPWGKRVLQYSVGGATGPTETIYFYSITGQRLAIYTGQYPFELTQTSVNLYFGSRLLAPMDRLGSVRQNANGAIAYFPWGEERTPTPNGTDKFATYFRDSVINGVGEDYASARYYNNNFGRFWSPDPAGLLAARPKNPTSWNRYAYANDDPINGSDPTGLDDEDPVFWCPPNEAGGVYFWSAECYVNPPAQATGAPCPNPTPGGCSGQPTPAGSTSSTNPCAFSRLSGAQQAMLANLNWAGTNAAQEQLFVDITADASSLGVPLAGLTVSSITIARQDGASQTELNLSGSTTALIDWLNNSGAFTSEAQDWMVGAPHQGYTGNYRQNVTTWSMQINTSSTGAQIDIDPFNPSDGLAGLALHGIVQWLPNRIIGGDTNPFATRSALAKRGVNVGAPCTGN